MTTKVVNVANGDYKVIVRDSGNITLDTGEHGKTIITGNLEVQGDTTYVFVSDMQVEDNTIMLNVNGGSATGIPIGGTTNGRSGLEIIRGGSGEFADAWFMFDETVKHIYLAAEKNGTGLVGMAPEASLISIYSSLSGNVYAFSDEIANAKPGKEVKIKVATPAKGDIVEFLQNMLLIMKHPLVVSPNKVIKSFIDVRNQYFATSGIEGILYYNKGKKKTLDPRPYLGRKNEWIIYGISAGNGKMMRLETAKRSKTEWLQAQVKMSK